MKTLSLPQKNGIMRGNEGVFNYVDSILVNFNHAVRGPRSDELSDFCLTLNILYRAKHHFPFNIESGFISDNFESEEHPILNPLPDVYRDRTTFSLIQSTYKELCGINPKVFEEIYADAVENVVKRLLFVLNKKIKFQPKELSKIICSLVAEKNCKLVYNPFAGISSFGLYLDGIDCLSQEINRDYKMIERIRLNAQNKPYSNYQLGDSFNEWDDHGADCIVASSPNNYYISPDSTIKTSSTEFLINAFELSKAKYAYIVVPLGFCIQGPSKEIRKATSEKNMLEMVVYLPSGLFSHTSIPFCLIVLNKEKNDNKVAFADASYCVNLEKRSRSLDVDKTLNLIRSQENVKKKYFDLDIIRFSDYIWNPLLYVNAGEEQMPLGFIGVRFMDIAKRVHGDKNFTELKGRVLDQYDIHSRNMSYIKEASSLYMSNDLAYYSRIDEPVLLISNSGRISPIYCKASSETPIFISNSVYAFTIANQWIDPSYLCLELTRKANDYGTSSTKVDLRILGFTNIALPYEMSQAGLDEQRRLYNEALESFRLNKAKELGLMEVIDKMKTDYINTVRTRKHDMKTPMTQIRNTLTLLKTLIEKVPEEVAERLDTYLQRQETALNNLSSMVSHLADEQVFADPEPVDLDAILSKEVSQGTNYIIDYHLDDQSFDLAEISKPIVMMGKADAVRLFQNIISNAIKHGFVDSNVTYSLNINLSIEEGFYIIRFVNNGKPLPEGIDKERFGIDGVKSGDSDGSGTGGFVVKSIAEHYGGDYDIFSRDSAGEKLTYVIVKLPIYLGNE